MLEFIVECVLYILFESVVQLIKLILLICVSIPCGAIAGIVARAPSAKALVWQMVARTSAVILAILLAGVVCWRDLSHPIYWAIVACVACVMLVVGNIAEYRNV